MSYSIYIYKKKLEPTKDFISFASFVSFFPQLVAGPIERAKNLIPQVLNKREFKYDQSVDGLRLILWGMFKKVVIADSLAPMVNNIFNNYQDLEGGILWVGAIYFAFQIYCDFSGYSDIAIGTAKLFGFELISNFKFPYFSRNIGEFWRRWHISLSSWFRDYLYIPLGGSKKGTFKSIRNIFIIFIVSGLWHGANWTFIIWGLFHSLLFIPSFIFKTNRNYVNTIIAEDRIVPKFKEFFQVFTTFILVVIGWVFFRSETLTDSFSYLFQMFFSFSVPSENLAGFQFIVPFLIFEYFIRRKERLNFKISENLDLILSTLIIFCIILFYNKSSGFIYFQF